MKRVVIKHKCVMKNQNVIPCISPIHFTKENSSRKLELSPSTHISMLEFEDEWKIVGWALASDVEPREMCPYVLLFQDEDGSRIWCHTGGLTLESIVEKVHCDPSRIAKLR